MILLLLSELAFSDTGLQQCIDEIDDQHHFENNICVAKELYCKNDCKNWNYFLKNESIHYLYICQNNEIAAFLVEISTDHTSDAYYFNQDGVMIATRYSWTGDSLPICCDGYNVYSLYEVQAIDCDPIPFEVIDSDTPRDTGTDDTACGCAAAPLPFATLLAPLLLLLRRRRSVPLA
jgi:hypothetical protein